MTYQIQSEGSAPAARHSFSMQDMIAIMNQGMMADEELTVSNIEVAQTLNTAEQSALTQMNTAAEKMGEYASSAGGASSIAAGLAIGMMVTGVGGAISYGAGLELTAAGMQGLTSTAAMVEGAAQGAQGFYQMKGGEYKGEAMTQTAYAKNLDGDQTILSKDDTNNMKGVENLANATSASVSYESIAKTMK